MVPSFCSLLTTWLSIAAVDAQESYAIFLEGVCYIFKIPVQRSDLSHTRKHVKVQYTTLKTNHIQMLLSKIVSTKDLIQLVNPLTLP